MKLNIMKKMKISELKKIISTNNEFFTIYSQNKNSIRMCVLWNTYEEKFFDKDILEKYLDILNENIIDFFIQKDITISYSVLKILIKHNKLDLIKYLIENSIFKGSLYILLSTTIIDNRLNIIQYFVESGGVNIKAYDDLNLIQTEPPHVIQFLENNLGPPLLLAIGEGHLDIVKYLIEMGAINQPDYVYIAIENGNLDIVKYLVESSFDINQHQFLIYAVMNNNLNIIEYFVDNGADIHTQNETPLYVAVDNENLDIVKYLVEKGARPDQAILDLAYNSGYNNIYNFLRKIT
jgi:ankyrin repeat protein